MVSTKKVGTQSLTNGTQMRQAINLNLPTKQLTLTDPSYRSPILPLPDMRNFRQSEYLDRLESDDEYDNVVVLRPCVKPLELTDEALDKERQRSLDVLAAVLGKSKAVPVVKTTVSKTSSAAADGGSSAVSTSVETGASSSSSSNSKTTKEQKEKEKLKEKSKEKAKEEEPFPVEEGPGKYTGTVASGFAQLGALKDIFHKEVRPEKPKKLW